MIAIVVHTSATTTNCQTTARVRGSLQESRPGMPGSPDQGRWGTTVLEVAGLNAGPGHKGYRRLSTGG
jgi:hypothetical protein